MRSRIVSRTGVRRPIAVHNPAIQVQALNDSGKRVRTRIRATIAAAAGETHARAGALTHAMAVRVLDMVHGLAEAAVRGAVALVGGAFFVDRELDDAGDLGQDLLRVLQAGRHAVFGGFGGELLEVVDGIGGGETDAAGVVVGVSVCDGVSEYSPLKICVM